MIKIKVLTPFTHTNVVGWIPTHLTHGKYSIESVAAPYVHDRSRNMSGGRDWIDFFRHAMIAFRGSSNDQSGIIYVTAFPQLAVTVGFLNRLLRRRSQTLAWCFNMGTVYHGLKGFFARFALQKTDLFVVHSTAEIKTYSDWLGIPSDRFRFVPLSIAENSARYDEDVIEPYILAMGTANRDYATLFAALDGMAIKTIVVAGAHALNDLVVPDCVEIRSGLSLSECHDLCQRARVNVIPIKHTGAASGQVTILEAMMYSKAVIATFCDGTRDYIVDRETGILVDPKDPAGLRHSIMTLWEDDALRRKIGAAARMFVLEKATFRAAAVQMEAILDDMTSSDLRRLPS